MPARYRFLLRPTWLLLHAVFVLIVFAMVNLGFWQLRRLSEKRDLNDLLDARASLVVEPLAAVVPFTPSVSTDPAAIDAVVWRTVSAVGQYRPQDEVLVRSRSLNGAPGAYVLTPLLLADGRAVAVNRGWIPASGPPVLPPEAVATRGEVFVEGLLVAGQHRGRFGPTDPADGKLLTLARADLIRLQQQIDVPLNNVVLQLTAQDPLAPAPLPQMLPRPSRDEGPHLSYAGQWFLFTIIAVVGYPLLLKRSVRKRELASS